MYRNHTRVVQIGDKMIGGGNPILIQSMTNTKTEDISGTVAQILELEKAGCEIIRCTVQISIYELLFENHPGLSCFTSSKRHICISNIFSFAGDMSNANSFFSLSAIISTYCG